MKYVLESTGEEVDVPDDPQEHALALAAGLVPADVVEAGKGTTVQAGEEAFQRGIGGVAAGIQGLTGLGTAPGLEEPPGGGLTSLQDAYSPEARLRQQAHPIAAGIGTGLAAAPLAGVAAATGGAALPFEAPLVGGAIGAIAGESAVQATAQEYDDAWLEQRPMQLNNVAAYTLMFAGGDLLFRGAVKGGKRLLFGPEAATATSLGGRNLVSEAQGAARELAPELAPAGGGGSVGAASAEDLSEPFDNALRTMGDKDAMVLARDSADHLHLAAQNSSEAFTRINQGISDSLGSQLKYEDFAANAQNWEPKQIERQAKWLDSITEEGDALARQVNAFSEGDKGAIDFGNLGKKAVQTIDKFNGLIAQESDPARRNWLVDNFKKQLDSWTMSVDSSFGVDNVTRTDLKNLVGPYREALRKGLENPKYWGENAELQKALNGPWHTFLQDWPAVQKQVLEATGHTQFDQMGAGRVTRESTVDRMLALLGKDPRSNQEFGKHLSGAFDGLQGLIEARQAHGIAGTEGLEAMAGDVRNLMEDWNLAQTVGVARNRVENMQRDPRKWAKLALDFAERAPVVGKPLQAGRHLLGALTNDLHLQKDTPIGAVWERAYQRYAKNPAMQDPSVARNYADWVIDALNQRGGMAPKPPAGAMGAPSAAMNDVMTGSPGFKQAAQPSAEGSIFERPTPGNPSPHGGGGSPAYNRAKEILRRRRGQSGHLVIDLPLRQTVEPEALDALGPIAEQAATKGNYINTQIAKMLKSKAPIAIGNLEHYTRPAKYVNGIYEHGDPVRLEALHAAADAAEAALGEGAGQTERSAARDAALRDLLSKATGIKTRARKPLSAAVDAVSRYPKAKKDFEAWRRTALPKEESDTLSTWQSYGYRVINGQVRSGPEAAAAAGKELLADGMLPEDKVAALVQDAPNLAGRLQEAITKAIEAGHNVPGRVRRGLNMPEAEVEKLLRSEQVSTQGFMSTSFHKSTPLEFAERRVKQDGGLPVVLEIEQKTGVPVGFGEGELLIRPGTVFDVVDASRDGKAVHVLLREASPSPFTPEQVRRGVQVDSAARIGAVLAVSGAALAANNAQAAEPPPPPAQSPEHAYRDALREIDKAGDQHIAALASSALRKRPPAAGGKGPLELFSGRRSLQDAVESSRDRLAEVGTDPAALVKLLGGSVGELGKTHPGVYTALVQKSAQLAAYLQQNVPQPTATTLLDPRGGKLSFDRAWDYAARYIGAAQPKVAMREVVRGTAPPEMIEAIQANWPEVWDGFKAHMLGMVQRMAAAGRHIPSEKLRRWDSMLGMDGQLDPSASLAVASHFLAAQDAEAQKRQQAGQKSGGGAASSAAAPAMQTRLGAINAERQLQ